MKRKIVSVLLGIIFSITFVFVVFSLTVLNKNFVLKVFKDNNYYEYVKNNLIDLDISEKTIQRDLKEYVYSRYKNEYIRVPDDNLESKRDIYNRAIKFDGCFENIDVTSYIYIIYFITLVLIVITGILLNKTKKKHDLIIITFINFLFSIIVFGLIYLCFDINNVIIGKVIDMFNHYYLAGAIILFDIMFVQKIKTKFI